MSDLERAVEAAARAYYDWATTNDGEESRWEFPGRHQEFARARAQLMLQAALDAGEIVLADRSVTPADWLTERLRAEAAEQALVLAKQDAERLARALCREQEFCQRQGFPKGYDTSSALVAHDLRVAQQEGTK